MEEFEAWYAGYPHKVAKGQARKAFTASRRKATLDELIEGVKRYIASKPPDIKWCNPATWLNGERWDDKPALNFGVQPKTATTYTPRVTAEQRRALVEKQLAERERNEAPRKSRPSYEDIQADLAKRGLLIGSKRLDH